MGKVLKVALVVVTVFLLGAIFFAMHDHGATTDVWAVVFWGVLDLVLAVIWFGRQISQRRPTDR